MSTPKDDIDAINEVLGCVIGVLAFLIELTIIIVVEIVSALVFLLGAILGDD